MMQFRECYHYVQRILKHKPKRIDIIIPRGGTWQSEHFIKSAYIQCGIDNEDPIYVHLFTVEEKKRGDTHERG